MRKSLSIFASISLIALLASCSGLFPARGDATIVIQLGGSASRALSDPPFASLPVLSSYRITVSGPGMEAVSYTIPGNSPSFSASIPAGPERTIELYAPVDWDATGVAFPDLIPTFPSLVKAYGASSTLDLSAGKTVNVAMRLEVAETKILLPDYSVLRTAMSMSDAGPYSTSSLSLDTNGDFEFDRFGRLYTISASTSPTLRMTSDGSLLSSLLYPAITGNRLSYDQARGKLYIFNDPWGPLSVVDLKLETLVPQDIDVGIEGYWYEQGSIAVDLDGYLYVAGAREVGEGATNGIIKVDVSNPSVPKVLDIKSYEDFGLGYYDSSIFTLLNIRDMVVRDDMLYFIVGKNNPYDHRGKLVEVDTKTFVKTRELGWSASAIVSDPSSQFIGPKRFIALKPRHLVIADEGYFEGNQNRVVEIDVDQWLISGIGLSNVVDFFSSYGC
jgi:hypothetical protein